jgi:PAS domain S-box-containing protein
MLTDHLVLAALDHQETISIVLVPTVPGQPPVIAEANDVFHRLTGLPCRQTGGYPLTILAGRPEPTAEWQGLLDAIHAGMPLRAEVPCFTASHDLFWFGFTLTHVPDPRTGREHPVLIGRDITVDRWKQQEQATANALMALAFMKVDAPVVLVREGGHIIMANPAMLALTGFTAKDFDGKHIRDLTHPDDVVPGSAAHLRPNPAGVSYRLRLLPQAKDGQVIPVWLTSELLENSSMGRVHVMTLIPELTEAAPVGRVETVSLQAVRTACGENWEKLSGRLILAAESVIKQRIGPRDIFARSANGDFSIWFAVGDEKETAACVATITREIRIRLLGELGEGGLNDVVGIKPPAPPVAASGARPSQRDVAPQRNDDSVRAQALRVVADLSADPAVEVTRVLDRDDHPSGLVWADLPRAARLRLDTALASVPEDLLIEAGLPHLELLRLRLAVAGIKRDLVEGQRRTWLLPVSFAAMQSRKRQKRFLEGLRTLQSPVQARLRGLLTGAAAGLSEPDVRECFEQLRPLLHGVGVLSLAPELPSAAALRPSCALVAIDLQAGPPPAEDAVLRLLGAARRLHLPVLVRTGQQTEARHWRKLGATLFAVTRSGP